ncbi:MAG TPA: glycosyltransferase family 39 protein [Mucilaginibacter sp.]|nr:glycosyltransferase family 39 protein [Mucilaginibacter sp.]
MAHFGFQRDELLYITLGDHLDWGFKEVPPFIALVAKLSGTLFGNTLFAARIFSTIFSGLIVWFTGKIVVEFSGKKFAIALACLAVIFSPAFAASGYLFEPVVFDQLWWVLIVYLLLRYLNTSRYSYLYFIGIVIGIGLLTKFSILFFVISIIAGLLITKERKILWNRYMLSVILIPFALFFPNMIWEIKHHLPLLTQMKELRSEQLISITPAGFFIQQLIINGVALFLSLSGLGFLLLAPNMRRFQFLGFAYLFTFFFLMALSGKNYYILGAYPMLFAAGACGLEKWLQKSYALRSAVLVALTLPNLLLLPLFLPVFPLDRTIAMFNSVYKNLPFLAFEARWDDQQLHPVPQNYGVMFGWDEMAEKVAVAYGDLSVEQQKHTIIYAYNYGEASSLHFYGKQYHLPEVICLNSSFSLWAPPKLNADYIIFIDDKSGENIRKLLPDMESCRKVSEIENPLAIEKGTGVFLLVHPKPVFYTDYQRELAQTKLQ